MPDAVLELRDVQVAREGRVGAPGGSEGPESLFDDRQEVLRRLVEGIVVVTASTTLLAGGQAAARVGEAVDPRRLRAGAGAGGGRARNPKARYPNLKKTYNL